MYLTKQEWLDKYKGCVSNRDYTLLGAAYDVLAKNTVPWGDKRVISPWSGPCAGIWNWDSAFHAMTVCRFDTELAQSCIDCFMAYQLDTGMLPDVIYVNGTIMDNYSKPPVMPWAVLTVYESQPDRSFLSRNYKRLVENERFWVNHRQHDGMFFYSAEQNPEADNFLHPRWESGWDNSPRWDKTIVDLWPVDLNCYMVLFYRSMSQMAKYLGEPYGEWDEKLAALSALIEERLFDTQRQTYADYDFKKGEFSEYLSPASFMPLFVGIASDSHAEAMAALAADSKKFYPGMPTITYDCPEFGIDYWRGPTWLNVAYFAIKGLQLYGFTQLAGQMKEFLLQMIYDDLDRGIWENYNSLIRKGRSNDSFSWSAAFIIEFILNM